jgi:hypothetical protein
MQNNIYKSSFTERAPSTKSRDDQPAPWLEALMAERSMPKRDAQPRIDAILMDGTSCQVRPKALDVLLENGHIQKFRRSSGWVTVGVDPVRAKRRGDFSPLYYGPERRRVAH